MGFAAVAMPRVNAKSSPPFVGRNKTIFGPCRQIRWGVPTASTPFVLRSRTCSNERPPTGALKALVILVRSMTAARVRALATIELMQYHINLTMDGGGN